MKKTVSIILILMLLLSFAGCGDKSSVSVQSVSMIASTGSVGFIDRCAGKVVSGQSANINKDPETKVLEVLVETGDIVSEGDVLFRYDAAAMELSLEKLRLELKNYENTIVSATQEIEELERQKSMVYVTNQLSYTIQIDSKQADIREAEYNKAIKEREIAAMEKSLEATDVTSPISGRVMSVAEDNGGENYYGQEASSAFITVMDVSSYRVQGNINELNLYSLVEGTGVLVRSRADETKFWRGTLSSIDWENPVSGNENNMYYYVGPVDEMTSSSKYPFYVELEDQEGLTLGQHVIIEPDFGQGDAREGLLLPSYYIMDAENAPYVWAANSRDKLEKRSLTLGEYDPELDLWQVLSGLEITDYLAFPGEGVSAGKRVSYFSEENFASGGDAVFEDFPVAEGSFDGGYFDEGFVSEGDPVFPEEVAPVLDEGAVFPVTEESPAGGTPAEEAPAGDAPVEEAPTEEAPAGDAPVEEAPTEEAPAGETPVEDASAEGTP